ncbi:uncharacterized protein LOC142348546 [Convolutriloba macropyga]|uniref:uncharacterized protein LOC142348546 n=1 Tax=Convolutriloba macropyga TaxID=536237 RepID=UPI003F5234D3
MRLFRIVFSICLLTTAASDQYDCSMYLTGKMNETHYKCAGYQRKCIEITKICNGVSDCLEADDEKYFACCPMGEGETNGTHFGCGQNMCIPNEKKCNGPIDCYNGRDETHCTDAENAGNVNKKCPLPYLTAWFPPWPVNCSYQCGQVDSFTTIFEYHRSCTTYKWDEATQSCQQAEQDTWCYPRAARHMAYICRDSLPCTITEVSIRTGNSSKYSSAEKAKFKFSVWRDKTSEKRIGCDLGILDNGKQNQRVRAGLDVYHPNKACEYWMHIDGRHGYDEFRVTHVSGDDGWEITDVNVTVNNLLRISYKGGKIWLTEERKKSAYKNLALKWDDISVLGIAFGQKEDGSMWNINSTESPTQ